MGKIKQVKNKNSMVNYRAIYVGLEKDLHRKLSILSKIRPNSSFKAEINDAVSQYLDREWQDDISVKELTEKFNNNT